ncbi:hypothetical protein [Shouchella lonarensis]|uniref:Uncharacterized protein n=1 Tax=Shouchella lonarensis TaxID=1464122 RepID=A0A1G6GK43_9BACI|nr:hypothetical protein [Shouchella lonarensis]SDB82368.1 hypothetical protein SAMN05421737_101175 [Shouchella lonarensis]
MSSFLNQIEQLLEDALAEKLTHEELADACEEVLFVGPDRISINDHISEQERDVLEDVVHQWAMFIDNTVDDDTLKPGWLKMPKEWLLAWRGQVRKLREQPKVGELSMFWRSDHYKPRASLNNVPGRDLLRMVKYHKLSYVDIESVSQLRQALSVSDAVEIGVGITLDHDLYEWFLESTSDNQLEFYPIKKNLSYVQTIIDKESMIQQEALLAFIYSVAEMNDFVFLVMNPRTKHVPFYDIATEKVNIDIETADAFLMFDYDGTGFFVFW